MDFSLTEDQELLRDTARTLLSRECPIEVVRAQVEGRTSATDPLWSKLREWVVLAGTAAGDGARSQMVELCLFLEETGAVLAPGPYFATAALFAPLLAAADSELLASVLAGDVTGTVAVAGESGQWQPHDGDVKRFVLEADRVDYVAAVVPGADGSSGDAFEMRLYQRPPARRLETIDPSRVLASVDLGEATPVERPAPISRTDFDSVLETASVALSAEMLGVVRWLFETTLEYAKNREQFDRPIGSFQAIKHKLADMALAKDEAWSTTYWAAMAIDAGDPQRHVAAHSAKVIANEAARLNAKDGMQIHGGIGFTYDHDLHLYLRRAYASAYLLGGSDWHRERLAGLLVDQGPG